MMIKRRQQGRMLTEEEELRRAFALFDLDGNGVIDTDECVGLVWFGLGLSGGTDTYATTRLRTVMHNLGSDLTAEEVELLIREADYDGDGTISLEEFATFMVSIASVFSVSHRTCDLTPLTFLAPRAR